MEGNPVQRLPCLDGDNSCQRDAAVALAGRGSPSDTHVRIALRLTLYETIAAVLPDQDLVILVV